MKLEKVIYDRYNKWLNSEKVDSATKEELLSISMDELAIKEKFLTPMQFGTAGLRSTMSAGIAKMNIYTVAHTTAGLAKLIVDNNANDRGVAIAFDSRNNSPLFAKTAACVLAGNSVKAYLFDSLRPTPELSFAIRHHNCIAGINITASHNPKEYNGYKVYWEDGAQLSPEHATEILDTINNLDIFEDVVIADYEESLTTGIIEIIGKQTDEAYINAVLDCQICPELIKEHGDSLNVVFTPIHGTGYKLVPEILKRTGVSNLYTVAEQMIPDGDFPTVDSPNPEDDGCFELALKLLERIKKKSDMILATDPDGDRLGVTVRDTDDNYITLTGNQIGSLLIDYIIKGRKEKDILPSNACAIKSIVSADLFDSICDKYNVSHMEVLPGFKYIGEKIKEFEEEGTHAFVFGYEESHGYLSGSYARDKDAIAAAMLMVEAASYYKSKGLTIYEALQSLYSEFGYFKELVLSTAITGIDPMSLMKEKMQSIRTSPPSNIGGAAIKYVSDYNSGQRIGLEDKSISMLSLPSSDMIIYELEDKSRIIVRPSGTEPKIKIYILVSGPSEKDCDEKIALYRGAVNQLI